MKKKNKENSAKLEINKIRDNVFLTGENICLTPLTREDISPEYTNWLNDSEVCRENSHATFPNTYSKTLAYIEEVESSETNIVFAIKWKKTGAHVGNVSLQSINYICRTGEIAILIGNKKYWNKGIGSESYKLLIEYGFSTLNLNRISSCLTVSNIGMIKVCEKSGMTKEGMLREVLYKNGKYLDFVIYSILSKEYQKIKQKKN